MRSITQDQVNFYNKTGYLIVEDVLSQDEIKELGSITDTFVEKSRNITEHNEDFDLEAGHSKENPKLRRIKKPEKQHAVYEKTLNHSGVLDVVEDLIGPNIRTLGSKLNMKAPGGGAQVEWHTDWAFYPHTNDDILEVGIPLDDMEIENGCLMAIPGSHKWEAI
ncbi:MAG: phytanoyl-CoA dioxygenase, partial [Chloroflexi bacterium]|nr:phytanoyl-CoA dioxygenase [Chloroflexota bacterium]